MKISEELLTEITSKEVATFIEEGNELLVKIQKYQGHSWSEWRCCKVKQMSAEDEDNQDHPDFIDTVHVSNFFSHRPDYQEEITLWDKEHGWDCPNYADKEYDIYKFAVVTKSDVGREILESRRLDTESVSQLNFLEV